MGALITALACVLLAVRPAFAQDGGAEEWALSTTAYTYLLPDEDNYSQPTIAVDRDWVHFEARYNYEERRTGSLWAGYNVSGGGELAWTFTPMVGSVFGDITGVAPGYTGSLDWRMVDFYTEGEWVFDGAAAADDFLYHWSELALAPAGWCRLGLVTQRTRVYGTEREVQRGVLVGFNSGNFDVSTYVFNPDDSSPIVVFAVGWSYARN